MTDFQEFPEHCGDHHPPMHPHHHHHPLHHSHDFYPMLHKCADVCDDQLPLFSQVGRGLRGDGYRIDKVIDEDNQTILQGVIVDPHTGEETVHWRTGNINGGKLTVTESRNPATNPKTFTLTFTLDRPDDPEDRGWTFTTPAIPYVWDQPSTFISTLFLKPKGNPQWTDVHPTTTPHSIEGADGTIHTIEKLIYPGGVTRQDAHAPDPGDPNTVNLTYGKGGDIDCPTTAETAADIATAKNQAVAAANSHLHKDLFGEGVSGRDYTQTITSLGLMPLNGDQGGTKSVWDWIQYAIKASTDHLHKDLYGGPNSADYASIPASLKPLDGDNNNGKTVWDWIKYVIDNMTDPTLKTVDLATVLGTDPWLVLVKPDNANSSTNPWRQTVGGSTVYRIPATITQANALAAIKADVEIEYYDVLPTICVSVTPVQTGLSDIWSSSAVYGGVDSDNVNFIKLGTGEMAIICTRTTSGGSSVYTPVNFRAITIEREIGESNIQYPTMNPENLSNTGFGWICETANRYTVYPAASGLSNFGPGAVIGSADYGNWEVYTGLGNVNMKANQNSLKGGWPWAKKPASEANAAVYGYLFNRSTGSIGVRVQIDFARTYTLSYD